MDCPNCDCTTLSEDTIDMLAKPITVQCMTCSAKHEIELIELAHREKPVRYRIVRQNIHSK